MTFYERYILPYLIALVMRDKLFREYRARVVPAAEGRVLEIGMGSGLNLPFYGANVREVIGLDPSPRLLHMSERRALDAAMPAELVVGSAEAIPLERASVDTVLTTWTMCSIPDIHKALGEIRRVLKPGGQLLFVEHGLAPDKRVRWLQNTLTPAWRRIGGGCHLNREMEDLIAGTGFAIEKIDRGYMRGPNPVTYIYEGSARPK